MADPKFCPYCGKESIKAHDRRVSYELGWSHAREEPVAEGEAVAWACDSCGEFFLEGPTLATLEECTTQRCKKCDGELDEEGYCKDLACPFSDWPQEVVEADLHELTQVGLERKYHTSKRARALG